jgi:hypothetical protein
MTFPARSAVGGLLALACAGAAMAHDTWFSPRGEPGALALATGNRFPVGELAVDPQYFAVHGCRAADATVLALRTLRFTETQSWLATEPRAATCFVQLAPFEFDVPLDKVDVYFKEARPEPAIVAAWTALRARGLPFHERYVKSARIELDAADAGKPAGTVLDALRTAPARKPKVGDEAVFQLLRDGKPLPDFNVELVNERSPLGLWHRTDREGRIRARLPLPGRWLLRGTELRLSTSNPEHFDSRFVTYAFDVAR